MAASGQIRLAANTFRVPAVYLHRITRPRCLFAAAVNEVPGRRRRWPEESRPFHGRHSALSAGPGPRRRKRLSELPSGQNPATRPMFLRIKSPLLCVRLLPDSAGPCRFVRDSADFAAAWYRALSDGTATSEQTWSKYGDGHVPKRPIRSVITLASVAAS